MKVYCGTDIIEVERVKNAILNTEKFLETVFSKNEIDAISKINSEYKYQRYAGRFAAKEAVYKAMSKILNKNKIDISFYEIEILNDENLNRRPYANFLNDRIIKIIEKSKIEIDVSISHINTTAVAMAVVKDMEEN